MLPRQKHMFVGLLWVVGALVGCRQAPSPPTVETTRPVVETIAAAPTSAVATPVAATAATPTVSPTAVPLPADPKELTVCLSQEPETLYLHADFSLTSTHVWQAIYENLYTRLNFDYEARGLVKIPTLEDGDARIETVPANAGDMVVTANGFVSRLSPGVAVINAAGELVTFDGSPLMMSRLIVDFAFQPMVWSDGVPVTAADSRFSFELQYGSHVDLNAAEAGIASYEVTDTLAVRYTSLPGGVDTDYLARAVPPLPQHQLAEIPPDQVAGSEAAARLPLANGPFMIQEWLPGDRLILVKNPHYYRASAGLPRLDTVTFRFVPDTAAALAQVLAGTCDIATQDSLSLADVPLFLQSQEEGALRAYFAESPIFEHIDFGVTATASYASKRPDWFGDVRVRQAMMMCTDRQQIVDQTQFGLGEIMNAYIPANHPLYPADLTVWPFDVAAANALLDEVGYLDSDGDGVREDPQTGTPFQVTLVTTMGEELRPQIGALFQEQMRACGLEVALQLTPAGEFFAEGPVGPVFGRQFDLALFSWLIPDRPPCNLYLSSAMPGPPGTFTAGWAGLNVTGWSNSAFDAACTAAFAARSDTPEYVNNHQEALRILAENVPAIPLLTRVKVTIARPHVQNLALDSTQESELWNLYDLDLAVTP